jgi:hypothetical protein
VDLDALDLLGHDREGVAGLWVGGDPNAVDEDRRGTNGRRPGSSPERIDQIVVASDPLDPYAGQPLEEVLDSNRPSADDVLTG